MTDTVLTLQALRSTQRVRAERAAFELVPTFNMLMTDAAENLTSDLTTMELFFRGEIHPIMQPTVVSIFHRSGWNVVEFVPVLEESRPIKATIIKIIWNGERE